MSEASRIIEWLRRKSKFRERRSKELVVAFEPDGDNELWDVARDER